MQHEVVYHLTVAEVRGLLLELDKLVRGSYNVEVLADYNELHSSYPNILELMRLLSELSIPEVASEVKQQTHRPIPRTAIS